MRIILESLRFALIFFVLSTILGVITHLTYPIIGINPEKYGWTAMIVVFILIFALYRNKGWGKVFNKNILWTSIILIVLLSILIPAVSPTLLHTNKYAYSYGFPFNFLTLYVEDGTKFLLPNLFSGKSMDWNLDMGVLGNFIIFYFVLRFIFRNLTNKQVRSNKAIFATFK